MTDKVSRIVDKNVRTAWVKKWTEDFLKGLKPLATKEEIEAYCVEQKSIFEAEVKRKSEVDAKKKGKETSEISQLNSAVANMSQIRNAIKEWQQTVELIESNSYPQKTKEGIVNQHFALIYMNYTKGEHEKRMQPTKEKKDEQRRHLTPINCVDEYLATIEKLLSSSDYRELAAGLIAATGRRISEILSTASFTQIGQFEVAFEGQLKAKGQTGEYPAFTIVESAKVMDAILKLRRMAEIKEMKNWNLTEIDSGKNNTVNRYVKQHFSELIEPPHGEKELSSKNLRAAYAAIAIYLFCPGNHSESLFIKEHLGHTSDATASNYEDYQVVNLNGKQSPHGAWVERIGEEMNKPKQIATQHRLRMTVAAKELIDNQEFLTYSDQLSRIEELIRLARIGKRYEEGKLVKEVVKVVEKPVEVIKEVVKVVEKPVEVIKEVVKEVEKPVEVIKEVVKEVEKPVEEVKPVEEKSTSARFEEMSNEELRGCQAPGSALEKIRRSVRTIKVYNEQQAEKKAQWAINVSTLEDLSGCHSKAVREYLDSAEGRLQVTDYNLEKGFGYQQNRGKGSIKEFVTW
jgi:integrase